MTKRQPSPRYALHNEVTEQRIGTFSDLNGFFQGEILTFSAATESSPGKGRAVHFEILDIHLSEDHSLSLFREEEGVNLYLEILTSDGSVIGEYYVAVALVRVSEADGKINLAVSGYMHDPPPEVARDFWDLLATTPPSHKGSWAHLSTRERAAWLEVIMKFRSGPYSETLTVTDLFMDGSHIDDLASFFIALGEAANGPCGYYGSNYSALEDCLKGGFGPKAPFVLHWSHFDLARQSLGQPIDLPDNTSTTSLDEVLDLFRNHGVEIDPKQ